MAYLLDTSICVFFLRGKLNIDHFIKEKGIDQFYISEITVFELKFGAENSKKSVKAHKVVDDFINGLSIIPIHPCRDIYAKEKVRLRKAGKPIHDEFDFLIGLTAVKNNLILVTHNTKDFKNIKGIKIEDWFQNI